MRSLKITTSFTRRDEKSVEKYLSEIARYEVLTPDQEYRLFRRLRNGDETALQNIVNHNLRFVVSVAKQYQHIGMHLNDLINEGNIGLIKAARKFDETKGFKFISYAVWWIRQSILTSLNDKSRKIRIPLNVRANLTKILSKRSELLQQYEREPTHAEIAAGLDVDLKIVRRCLETDKQCASLDAPLGHDNDAGLSEVIPDATIARPDHDLAVVESRHKEIVQLLKHLPPRQELILSLFYGIGENNPQSLGDIADRLDLSRERVRQIKDRAIHRLRHRVSRKIMKAFSSN